MTEYVQQIKIKSFGVCLVLAIALLLLAPPEGRCDAISRETPVVKAVRKVSPAVVNISSEYEVRKRANPFSGLGVAPFFDSFFKDFFDPRLQRRETLTSLGSGVIIDGQRGLILTNAHVIEKTATIQVTLKDEREFEATIVGVDPDSDLAVLKITSPERLPDVQMGHSDDVMIGETVIAIGNPFGFSHTVTTGVVSATHRSVRTDERVFHEFIQIDASINPGNSGGPLLNINGELIGINTAIYAKAQGIGFAIPIDRAQRIVADLVRYGEVIQAWIGITVQELDERLARYLKMDSVRGALVEFVEPDSPASRAGIHESDVILSVGKQKVHSVDDYRSAVRSIAAGERIEMTVFRSGVEHRLDVTTDVYPLERAMDLAFRLMGVHVADIHEGTRRHRPPTASRGVVITDLRQGAYLADIGVAPGDVIRQIDEQVLNSVIDFKSAIIRYRMKKSVVILLQREDQLYYITVNLS